MVDDLFNEINEYLKNFRETKDKQYVDKIKCNVSTLMNNMTSSYIFKRIMDANVGLEYSTSEVLLGINIPSEFNSDCKNILSVSISNDAIKLLDFYISEIDGKERIAKLLKDLAEMSNYSFEKLIWVISHSVTLSGKLTYDCILSELYKITTDSRVIECVYLTMKWCYLNKSYLKGLGDLAQTA